MTPKKEQIVRDLNQHLCERMSRVMEDYTLRCQEARISYADAVSALGASLMLLTARFTAEVTSTPPREAAIMFGRTVASIRAAKAEEEANK